MYNRRLGGWSDNSISGLSRNNDGIYRETVSFGTPNSLDIVLSDSYNEEKDWKDNNMSFVGLQLDQINGKVIAFADSKATMLLRGNLVQDEKRIPLQKIFFNDDLLLVTYGQNEYVDEYGQIIRLEELLSKNMSQLRIVFSTLMESYSSVQGSGSTHFLYVEKNSYVLHYVVVEPFSISHKKINVANDVRTVCGGDDLCLKIFEKNEDRNSYIANQIRKKIEAIIDFLDEQSSYNPVGKPVQIVEWNWR